MTDQQLIANMVANIKDLDSMFCEPLTETRTRDEQIAELIESQLRAESTYPESERIGREQLTRRCANRYRLSVTASQSASGKGASMFFLLWFAMLHYHPVGPQPTHTATRTINVHAVGPVSTGMHRY